MAKAPAVRNVAAVQKSLQGSIQPQLGLLDESIASNANAGMAQEAGLKAKQTEAFGNIEQGAVDKGMFFSGFSPDQQAKYTSTTYLPALAQLQATIAQTRSDLLGKKADLNTSIFNKAFDSVEQDRSVLADWNKMTAQQRFDASQAQKDRAFKAQEAQKERQFTASQNAANRAAQASAAVEKGAPAALVNTVYNNLNKKMGKDKFVSPETYRSNMNTWIKGGGSPDSFNATFGAYVNQEHQKNYGGYI